MISRRTTCQTFLFATICNFLFTPLHNEPTVQTKVFFTFFISSNRAVAIEEGGGREGEENIA